MLIVRLFTVNGNLYSTSFCISAILEWEFRSDSISRCFCCWRLVRPAGDPAAEDDALFARGKSQLILLGSPGPRPYKVLACCSSLSPVLPGRSSTARTGCPGAAPSPTRRARESLAPGVRATTAGGWRRATRRLDGTPVLKICYFYFVCIGVLPVCIYVRVSDPLKLELQTIVSCHVSAGN